MQLVIVESPTKARTIGKFLGSGYRVASSYGHIRDLPKSKLGIDIEHGFLPQYVVPQRARKAVTALRKFAKESDGVILATDEDREGEAIAWHLIEALGLPRGEASRIVFHEITARAIEAALKEPRKLDMHLVDAQQARRVLDRLVGYNLSPFLWRKVARGLSAGRVQSVALRLIVDREREIRAFRTEEYWTIAATFLTEKGDSFDAGLVNVDGAALEKFSIKTQEEAAHLAEGLRQSSFRVAGVEVKEMKKNPFPPFTTSTMQQEAAKRLGFSAKKTMAVAQRLYEEGHITYMRTDSVNLSEESLRAAHARIRQTLGESYAAQAPRRFTTKSRLSQEAHEAIRPTNVERAPEDFKGGGEGEEKLYRLIWQRFFASQLSQARIAATTIHVEGGSGGAAYGLRANGQRILFDGFLNIWPHKFMEKELPAVERGAPLSVERVMPEQHFTEPPPRYSEATLIKTLEEFGIGRPSTYAPIISLIQVRNYVEKMQGRFHPTSLGELVNQVLVEHFPEVVDVTFTARMEEDLDAVAEGKKEWGSIVQSFYEPFAARLARKYEEVSKQSIAGEETNERCEKCGKPMVVRLGRFGKFLACSGFPECKTTKPLPTNGAGTTPLKSTGLPCPSCGEGEIVERRVSRGRARGKIFWGCNRYPKCTYASWADPTKTKGESSK